MTLSTNDVNTAPDIDEAVNDDPAVQLPDQGSERTIWERVLIHGILAVASLIAIAPFVWALGMTFQPLAEISASPLNPVPQNPTLDNYVTLWTDHPFDRWIINSLLLTVGATFLALLFDSLAGFALAKGDFVGRDALFMLVIGTLVIPPQVILVPLFLNMQGIGWGNTYWAMMALWVAGPFGTFMMRQFFLSIPDSLIEAARMDGCSLFDIYLRIALPMGKPALASLTIFLFIFVWGAFLWPLIIADSSAMFPLQVGIGLLTGPYTQDWGVLMAASVLAAAPVITAYLFAQREFMEGIALTGGKG